MNAYDDAGVDIGYEIHLGEDVFDGHTFEMFVDACGGHERAQINYYPSHFLLQQMDYLGFIDLYHDRICAYHVRTPNLIQPHDKAFIPDMPDGQTAPHASAALATDRSTLPEYSQNSANTDTTDGRFWNGNAA